MNFCRNEYAHEDEGRDDFRRRGRYGVDRDKQASRFHDDCSAAYMRGFEREQRRDEERREDERREEREEQERLEAARRRREEREEEECRNADQEAMELAELEADEEEYARSGEAEA